MRCFFPIVAGFAYIRYLCHNQIKYYMAKKITDSITYIGADDTDIELFENQYPLPHGVSYNSYFIDDEKIAVTDTIDIRCSDIWFEQLAEQLAGRQPDYLIVHHMEPDHSANILRAMRMYTGMKLVATAKAIAMLPQFFESFDFADRCIAVRDGDTLSLGKSTLTFITAAMIHWPEVMMTYVDTDHLLFSADAFGKFGAISYGDDWLNEARRYYVNIVGKYGPQVQSAFRKLEKYKIDVIAPLHGPALTSDIAYYVSFYDLWSTYVPEQEGTLVAYASIYGSTARAALRFAEMLRSRGDEVVTVDLCREDMSEAVAQAFRMSRLVVAAPTYDSGLFPAMHDFLHHLRIKNYQGRKAAIIENGSWAPVAGKLMREMLSTMKNVETVDQTVTIRSSLHAADLPSMEALADDLLKKS